MSKESTLKQRLIEIKQNDYRMDDESQVWPLTMQMTDAFDSLDSEFRDDLIFDTVLQWVDLSYYDGQQLRTLLDKLIDDEHLFYGLGEQGTDSAFIRSTAGLVLVLVVRRHLTHPFLDEPTIMATLRRMLDYLPRERDLRPWHPTKGCNDAVSHAADVVNRLAQFSELGKEHLLDILAVVRQTVVNAPVVFPMNEDERLTNPVLTVAGRGLVTKEEMAEWLAGFLSFELPPTWLEWLHREPNAKTFLRSLYFRSRYADASEIFEPALSEVLKEVSNRWFPKSSFAA